MALSDIQFPSGEKAFLVEVPTAVYTGKLSDIVFTSDGNHRNTLIHELLALLTLISYRRKVR